jgi:hypothetical protein
MSLRSRLSSLALCACAAAARSAGSAHACLARPSVHRKWHSPAVQRSMVAGMWMIDANFESAASASSAIPALRGSA